MQISWKDNIKKTVRLAYLGGKPVRAIWLQNKQLYPDASAASVLALRPMNASEGGDYGPWAWIMDIMKERGRDEDDYEFIVENGTDLNGGRDFVVVSERDYSDFWAEENGWSGSFDPETYLLSCYTNDMKIWAGMQEVGGKIKVKMRNTVFLQKRIDIEPMLTANPNHAQISVDLPYMYSEKDMSMEGFEGVSLGLNYRFLRKKNKNIVMWAEIRVMGNPSGTTHIHGDIFGGFAHYSDTFSGGRSMKDPGNGAGWFSFYDDPSVKLEWQKGDTGMVIDYKVRQETQPNYADYELELIWPENEDGKYYNWSAVIERKA